MSDGRKGHGTATPDPAYAAAFMRSPCAMLLTDLGPSGSRVADVNDAFCALTETDRAVLIGRPLDAVLHAPESAEGSITSAVSGPNGNAMVTSAFCMRGDGSRLPVELNVSVFDEAGSPTHAVIVVHGRISRTELTTGPLRNQIRRLQDIVERSPALIYVKDRAGRFLYVNEYFANRFGVDAQEVIGKDNHYIFPAYIAEAFDANDRVIMETGKALEIEEPAAGPHGAYRSVKFPLVDDAGGIYAVAGISTDITDLKAAEAEAQQARDAAEQASRAKSEFLSRVSHELRTPLNSIIGFSQLMLSGTAGEQTEQRQNVGHILHAGQHLLSLINELLEQSQIESGQYSISVEPVLATAPLAETLELVQPLASQRSIELSVDLHRGLYEFVLADHRRLTQALLNVITNGIKYNKPGGRVSVSFERAGEDRLRYLIADTGPGIRESDLGQLFLPFQRLAAAGSGTEGTGLGLTVSKSLVEAMGGKLGVLPAGSPSATGSRFFIELSTTAPPPNAHELVFRSEPGVGRPVPAFETFGRSTVLYIEDTPVNIDLVEQCFAAYPEVTVAVATDGASGLSRALRRPPDVILLDLHLPDVPGDVILTRLRQHERTRQVPVVVLSADATAAQEQRMRELGAADYVRKPFDVADLLIRTHDAVHAATGATADAGADT